MHASTRRLMPRLVAGAGLALLPLQPVSPAAAQASLAGQVTATGEGAMEGVIVSAKKDGSTVTVGVISDAQGRYSFPTGRLEPGRARRAAALALATSGGEASRHSESRFARSLQGEFRRR